MHPMLCRIQNEFIQLPYSYANEKSKFAKNAESSIFPYSVYYLTLDVTG